MLKAFDVELIKPFILKFRQISVLCRGFIALEKHPYPLIPISFLRE